MVAGPGPKDRFFAQGQRLLRRRDAARLSRAHHLAFGPACAPAPDGARPAGRRAGSAAKQRTVGRSADARQGLGRRAQRGLRGPAMKRPLIATIAALAAFTAAGPAAAEKASDTLRIVWRDAIPNLDPY